MARVKIDMPSAPQTVTTRLGTTPSANEATAIPPGYKQTEVGVIPEDWEVVRLSELGKLKNGINKSSAEFGHGSPFVNLMDVFGVSSIKASDEFGLVETNGEEQQTYDIQKGDVIFIRSSVKPSGVGLSAVVEEYLPKTVYSGFLIRFRDSGELDNGFKRYCFHEGGFRKRILATSSVSANTNINQNNLKRLPLPLPPTLSEQRAIAEALSDVDELLEALEKLIVKKQAIKQAAMQQLLTGKTRLPEFSGAWEMKRLGQLGAFSKGRGITREDISDSGLPCVRYGELYTRYEAYVFNLATRIPSAVASTALPIKTGDLLFAGSGETPEEIGRCAAYVGEEQAYAGGDIVVLTPVGQESIYLGHLMNYRTVAIQKARMGQGDAVVHISASNLAQVQISLPPVEEQTAVAAILLDMNTEITALEQRRDKTRAIKQGMMQQLLTGRVRLVSAREGNDHAP